MEWNVHGIDALITKAHLVVVDPFVVRLGASNWKTMYSLSLYSKETMVSDIAEGLILAVVLLCLVFDLDLNLLNKFLDSFDGLHDLAFALSLGKSRQNTKLSSGGLKLQGYVGEAGYSRSHVEDC